MYSELLVRYLVFWHFAEIANCTTFSYLSLFFSILVLLKMQVMIAKLAVGQKLSYHSNVTQIILLQVTFNLADASQTL